MFGLHRWGVETTGKHGGFFNGPDNYRPGELIPHKWERCTKFDNSSLQTKFIPSYALASLHSNKKIDIGRSLQRHPFSGLVHSAGELLHTP